MSPAVPGAVSTTLGALAVRFGCELRGDPDIEVDAVATLQNAAPRTIAFLANPKYRKHLASTRAAAVILDPKLAAQCPVAALLSPNPYALYARIAAVLSPIFMTHLFRYYSEPGAPLHFPGAPYLVSAVFVFFCVLLCARATK